MKNHISKNLTENKAPWPLPPRKGREDFPYLVQSHVEKDGKALQNKTHTKTDRLDRLQLETAFYP
jgi:hypothetical protein